MGYIYLVTNTVNGKQYVGQSTSEDINTRWGAHKRAKKMSLGTYLYRAYQKYGVDKFKYKIICICFNEDCNRYETEYIKKYNTIIPNGYNMKAEGESYKVSDETRAKISKTLKEWWETTGKNDPSININKGKPLSDAQKEKLRVAHKKRWAAMDEKTRSEEIRKIQEARRYINTTTGEVSRYKTEESRLNALKGLEKARQTRDDKFKDRSVAQYSKSGELLATYQTVSDAARKSGVYYTTISKVCRGVASSHTAGGFVWKYHEEPLIPK
jgi:group I intron endonuclease